MEEIFYKIFEALPRQGPGDGESTKKAFQKLTKLPQYPEILDVGCGTGSQTVKLAELTPGKITALDNHAPFIEILKLNAINTDFVDRIRCVVGDMNSMDFSEKSFDVIWSEGAAYIMGFENALNAWKPLLRKNGYMVVSELVWFKKQAPKEINDFFKNVYPDIKYFEDIYIVVEAAGYELVDYFPLPSESWWTEYYTPAEKKIGELRKKYFSNAEAQSIFDSFQLEIDMYRKYSDYYGYGFYILRRKNS